MRKRSKLNLSASCETEKKQPAGFRVPPSPTSRPARAVRREHSARPAASLSPAGKHGEKRRQTPTWLNARTITKTLLVVGAAAFTLLVLRQRLF